MKHLTTVDNIKKDGRFSTASQVDNSRFEKAISDCEQFHIKKQIGDAVFIDLIDYVNTADKSSFPDYSILLNGGIYEDNYNETKSIVGLIETLNCYVYANLVKTLPFSLTRFGFVNKKDNYSEETSLKDRLAQEKHTLVIADDYLKECIIYLRSNREQFPKFKKGKQRNRITTRIIGD